MAESAAPKVSIVTIFLDAARFLPEALASVVAQDFADWELLLVDDGSGDGSAAIARAAAEADPARVRCLAHPGGGNRGMGASRNLAFAAARGEYLVRLDADDAFATATALSEQVALLDAHPGCGLVAGPVEYWASWRGGADVLQALPAADAPVAPPALLARAIRPGEDEPISMMVRRAAVLEVGGCETGIRNYGEDFALTAKLLARNAVLLSPRVWYRYRMHEASYSQRVRAAGRAEAMERRLLDWLAAWLRAAGIRDPAVWQAYRERRAPLRFARTRRLWRNLRDDAGWLGWRLRMALRAVGASGPAAQLRLDPDRHAAPAGGLFVSTVGWTVPEGQRVQVRVGAPDGMPFVADAVGPGARATHDWVGDRLRFFLQDGGATDPGARSATLAIARARVLPPRASVRVEVDGEVLPD